MRLLICTQALDRADLSLGFFHRWTELFAHGVDALDIICLTEGDHALPANVRVHSLGKEHAQGSTWVKRIGYGLAFWRHMWRLRHCDAVLVHMNDEYMLLGSWFWRLRGTRLGLWRNHVEGDWKAALSCRIADVVFYTSPTTYASRFAHAYRMPVGIDCAAYAGDNIGPQGSVLSLGRIDPVKKIGEMLDALLLLQKEGTFFNADIYGTATPGREAYGQSLEPRCTALAEAGVLRRHAGVKSAEVPAIFRAHQIFINLTPPGSFDKTIFEAMAAGCLVVAANPGVADTIGDLYVPDLAPQTVARALSRALALAPAERQRRQEALRAYVQDEHSLGATVHGVLKQLQ